MSYWSSCDDDTLVCDFVVPKFVISGSFEASDRLLLLSTGKAATEVTTIIIVTGTEAIIVIIFVIVKWPNAVVSATEQLALFVVVAGSFDYLDQLT